MPPGDGSRSVETVFELRFRCQRSGDALTRALTAVRTAGGDLRQHSASTDGDEYVVDCVCERASEAALALREQGVDVRVETALLVRTEDRPGALGHLVRSIAAAEVAVLSSYGTSAGGELRAVLRTADNPRAEDALHAFLGTLD